MLYGYISEDIICHIEKHKSSSLVCNTIVCANELFNQMIHSPLPFIEMDEWSWAQCIVGYSIPINVAWLFTLHNHMCTIYMLHS